MSTDIGALQKQYKTLQQKQHHACVVLSGIGQQTSNPSPNSPDGSGEENDFLNNSMAVMTLSVTMDTEKVPQERPDAVSPTAFGKTKCIFIQNNTKKCLKKHKGCSDKSRHHRKVAENGTPKTIEEFDETTETDNIGVDVKEQVCKNDPGMHEIDSAGNNELIEKVVKETEHEEDRKGASKLTPNDACRQSEALLEGKDHVNDSNIDKVSENADSSKLGKVNHEGSGNTEKCEQEIADDSKYTETTNGIRDKAELEKGPGLEVKIENSVHSRSDNENRGRDFYKPYYPMKKIKPSTKRQNSLKIASEQSIYQHFTMTKRQLSLDSALEECNHKNVTNSGMDFPFPVHSINQHKIQAGVKLGLYDQHALEKLETMKPRKSGRKRLPSLNVE